jgi:predicted metal-dependent enzyme (double-stranded beta helix superfamily)
MILPKPMDPALERFASACHEMLKADPGPAGRRQVCSLLEEALKDQTFLTTHLTETTPERKILYEDPELRFCILAHAYRGAKDSPPHDHGPSWAIYGQARGETHMTDWELVEPASADKPGKVRPIRSYKLTPGTAHLYNEHDLHSPRRAGPTALIRIEGLNMDKIRRLKFEPA